MPITFDKINKLIIITTDTEVTIQNLINAIRDYEDENENLEIASLANAYGKQDLGGGAQVGITLELINNWRIQFEDKVSWTTCYIKGGNLVAINDYGNNPIKSAAYVNTIIAQSSSPTVVETGVSGLTGEESTQLMGLPSASDNVNAIWNEEVSGHTTPNTFGQTIDKVKKDVGLIKSLSL